VPLAAPTVPGFPGTPPVVDAFDAVATVFPLAEAVSVQTFETAP
jgi:hypothetical protein